MFGLVPYRKRGGLARKPVDIFDIENFFESFFNDGFFPALQNFGGQMKVDIKDTGKEYIVEAEVPGYKKDEVNIELTDDRLTITAEKKEEVNEERENYVRRERRYGSQSRSFYVDNINHDEVTAKFENGILTIVLPKVKPTAPKNRKIDIQ